MSPNRKPATSLTGLEYREINATEAEQEDPRCRNIVLLRSPYEGGRRFAAVSRRSE
ncbi:hypothetical protein [Methanochimaera problematica]|uniref:hypothetical protein n=1 Tax=Methanochimaera problematica TaxID=2609417 RepID=UPI002938D726|nr:hypothetical protein [Methanoplanus sp. FWC-SCC4]